MQIFKRDPILLAFLIHNKVDPVDGVIPFFSSQGSRDPDEEWT